MSTENQQPAGYLATAWPSAYVCGSPSACELTTTGSAVVARRPATNPARYRTFARCRIHHDRQPDSGPRFQNRARLTDGRHHPHTGYASLGDLLGHGESHTVVAAEARCRCRLRDVAAHLRSMVSVRKCAEHEMHGSWLRIDFSHNDVNVASSNDRFAATSSAISCSIAAWFCAVGGTIVADSNRGRRRRSRSGGTAARAEPR